MGRAGRTESAERPHSFQGAAMMRQQAFLVASVIVILNLKLLFDTLFG